jgi:polyisoprenoid-binding protein YceI
MIAKYFFIPLMTAIAATAAAQATDGARLVGAPGSELSFEGTSTLHAFHCKTTKFGLVVNVDPTYVEAKLSQASNLLRSVDVVIPVKSLSCGNKGLEENMFKTLKADKFPEIRYHMSTYQLAGDATDDGVTLQAIGTLTVAGQSKTIAISVKTDRGANGSATATGTQEILMTDFGIKPPVFMLGALRTGNKVIVSFKLNATPSAVALQ